VRQGGYNLQFDDAAPERVAGAGTVVARVRAAFAAGKPLAVNVRPANGAIAGQSREASFSTSAPGVADTAAHFVRERLALKPKQPLRILFV
jgi:hypothetical protein